MSKHRHRVSGDIPPKPKRPLTNYNLFYRLERNYIVQQHQKRSSAPPTSPSDVDHDPYLSRRPQRYHDVVLPYNWYKVGMNKVKRSKYKSHGVISFQDLAQEVKTRWRTADAETKQYCDMIADEELERYKKDVAAFVEKYGMDALGAQKKPYKKRTKKNANTNHQTVSNKEVDDDELVSDESEDGQNFRYEFGESFQFPGLTAHMDVFASPINRIGAAAAATQNDPFRAQQEESESTKNDFLFSHNHQILPGYWPDTRMHGAAATAQQFNPCRAPVEGSKTTVNSNLMNCHTQRWLGYLHNPSTQFTEAEITARQYDPFGAQVKESEPMEIGYLINSYDQMLPDSSPCVNPRFTGAAATARQNNPFGAQSKESESIENRRSANQQDSRLAAYLQDVNDQFTGAEISIRRHDTFKARGKESETTEYSHLADCHGQHLSDYLPDDREAALALVDYDSDNIL